MQEREREMNCTNKRYEKLQKTILWNFSWKERSHAKHTKEKDQPQNQRIRSWNKRALLCLLFIRSFQKILHFLLYSGSLENNVLLSNADENGKEMKKIHRLFCIFIRTTHLTFSTIHHSYGFRIRQATTQYNEFIY